MDNRFELLSVVETLTSIAKEYKWELDQAKDELARMTENYRELYGQLKAEQAINKDSAYCKELQNNILNLSDEIDSINHAKELLESKIASMKKAIEAKTVQANQFKEMYENTKDELKFTSLGLEAACENIQKLKDELETIKPMYNELSGKYQAIDRDALIHNLRDEITGLTNECSQKDVKINQVTSLYQLERQELTKERLKQKLITKTVYKDIQPELRYDSNGYSTYYRGHNGWFLIGDVCKALAIPEYGRNRVFAMLKGLGVLDKDGFCYQKYIDLGYLKLAERYYEDTMVGFITVINEKGITWLKGLIRQDIANRCKGNQNEETYVPDSERVEMVLKETEQATETKE